MGSINITLIGYGIQGSAVAHKLALAGHRLTIFDIDPIRMQLAAKSGFTVARDLEEAIQAGGIILIVVTAGSSAKNLILDPTFLTNCSAQKKIVLMGSYPPKDVLEISTQLSKHLTTCTECILSAPTGAVLAGVCPLLFGGDQADLSELEDLFQPIGKIHPIGKIGDAAAFNLAGLNVLYALVHSFAISTAMLERSHIDLSKWFAFFSSGLAAGAENLFKLNTDFLWPVHFEHRNYQLTGPFQLKSEGAANESEMIAALAKDLKLNNRLVDAIHAIQAETKKAAKVQDWTYIYEYLSPSLDS